MGKRRRAREEEESASEIINQSVPANQLQHKETKLLSLDHSAVLEHSHKKSKKKKKLHKVAESEVELRTELQNPQASDITQKKEKRKKRDKKSAECKSETTTGEASMTLTEKSEYLSNNRTHEPNNDDTIVSAKKHKQKKKSKLSANDMPTELKSNKASKHKELKCDDTPVDCSREEMSENDKDSDERRTEERKKKKQDKKLKKELKISEASKEETTLVGPSGCDLALDYLTQWQTDRETWRFQKVRQVWLLQNMYSEDKTSDDHFKTLLLYLNGMKGKSREQTLKQAEEILASGEDSDGESKSLGVSEGKLSRARQIIQVLT